MSNIREEFSGDLDDFSKAKKYDGELGIFVRGNIVTWRTKYKGLHYGDYAKWDEPDVEKAYEVYKKKFEGIKKKIDENYEYSQRRKGDN